MEAVHYKRKCLGDFISMYQTYTKLTDWYFGTLFCITFRHSCVFTKSLARTDDDYFRLLDNKDKP